MNKNKKTKKQKKQGIKGGSMFRGVFRRSNGNPAAVSNTLVAVGNSPSISQHKVTTSITVKIVGEESPIVFNIGDMIKCKLKKYKASDDDSYYHLIIIKFNNENESSQLKMECLPWLFTTKIIEGYDASPRWLLQKESMYKSKYSTDKFEISFSEIKGDESLRLIDYKTLKFIDYDEYYGSKNYQSAIVYSVLPRLTIERPTELTPALKNESVAELPTETK
jgi:hypothetical protein